MSVIGRNEMMISWQPSPYPIGRFFRFELLSNGKVIYSGHERTYHVINLTPDTDYLFMVRGTCGGGVYKWEQTPAYACVRVGL